MSLPAWPPQLTDDQRQALTAEATNYALAKGLLFAGADQEPPLATAHHSPFSLFPSPFPRRLFEQAKTLQSTYNILYARVATDYDFLERVLGEQGVSRADPFVRRLWKMYKDCRDEGLAQPIHMGIVRSDYLLHNSEGEPLSMRQVEFNAIGCAFGPHSQIVGTLHRFLFDLTGYFGVSPLLTPENFPPNYTIPAMASGMADGHAAYGVPSAWVLFIVSEKENNIFDQRWLEYAVVQNHNIRVVRQTYDELLTNASLSPTRQLFIRTPLSPEPVEIAVVYFRAGWAPSSFPREEHFDARHTLERSRAIKCPTLPLQLSGSKKIQQELAAPGALESFLSDPKYGTPLPEESIAAVRATFAGMWGLDALVAERGLETVKVSGARKELVLKPQREGGGNNVYGADIPSFLDTLPQDERQAWIAMETIVGPRGLRNHLVRAGVGGTSRFVEEEIVSELGIFGTMLFKESDGKPVEVLKDKEAGYLLRTKEIVNNEGGVGVGFSVLDSVVLVDG
ncbi:glutathione synthase [Exidia glandulosa HHB12029]|uniref:Glutathione synthetase n=1 Tax=Exidia glandulosa HHB12029 TaxID=1314781 RepID=A0A165L387_EXIGL|nr:glutathione synthase [Exidia glandulosa HHB12029]